MVRIKGRMLTFYPTAALPALRIIKTSMKSSVDLPAKNPIRQECGDKRGACTGK